MCGRYDLHDYSELVDNYDIPGGVELRPNYNAAPTQNMPVITDEGLHIMRWGLIPKWAKDKKIGYKLINARSESVYEKPIWKGVISKRRCLVPANGFYEWQKRKDGKQPFLIQARDHRTMMFAGVWEEWKHGNEEWHTYSILTTKPNKEMSTIHDRMPVILHKDTYDQWLGADRREDIEPLFTPLPDGSLTMHEVSKEVNIVNTNNESLILPINSQ